MMSAATKPISQRRKVVVGIALFYVLAFGLTLLFAQAPATWEWGGVNVRLILCGWGPLLSGLLCYRLVRTENACGITLVGQRPLLSLGIVLLAIVLPILTARNASTATVVGLVATHFTYSFGEEFGWRHYLQNATSELNDWLQAVVIGVFWFFWHYSFLDDPIHSMSGGSLPQIVGIPLFILILSGFSLFLGKVVTKTGSILLPTVAHYVLKTGSVAAIGVVFVALIAIVVFWHRLKRRPGTSREGPPDPTECHRGVDAATGPDTD